MKAELKYRKCVWQSIFFVGKDYTNFSKPETKNVVEECKGEYFRQTTNVVTT